MVEEVEVQEPEFIPRTPGQDLGNPHQVFLVPETPHIGHRADADAWTRSKNKVYKRKIAAQKKAKS